MFAQYRAYLKCAPTRYSRLRVAADVVNESADMLTK